MPVCRFHGMFPCLECNVKLYKICEQENKTRKTDKHDLTELKKQITELGGLSRIE